jgi:hypothetical protein
MTESLVQSRSRNSCPVKSTPTPVSGIPGSASTASLRVMVHTRWSAEAWSQVKAELVSIRRVPDGSAARDRAELVEFAQDLLRQTNPPPPASHRHHLERLPRRVQKEASDDATRTKGLAARRALPAHLGCDGPRRVRVGVVTDGYIAGHTTAEVGSEVLYSPENVPRRRQTSFEW